MSGKTHYTISNLPILKPDYEQKEPREKNSAVFSKTKK
jgi:hypothetical protein